MLELGQALVPAEENNKKPCGVCLKIKVCKLRLQVDVQS